jgi:hypothetical protein
MDDFEDANAEPNIAIAHDDDLQHIKQDLVRSSQNAGLVPKLNQ